MRESRNFGNPFRFPVATETNFVFPLFSMSYTSGETGCSKNRTAKNFT
jgi:hypothetical protein